VVDTAGAFGPIIQSVLSSSPPAGGSVDAALAGVLGANKSGKPIVDVLLLFDKSDGRLAFARDVGVFLYNVKPTQIVGVDSWESLAAELGKYSTIGRLVIWAHGTPGAPMVNAHIMAVDKLRDLLGKSKVQVTGSILFEGCDTMQKPIDMSITVARIAALGATLVGYTYSMVIRTFSVPKDKTVEQVQEILDDYEGYWVSETDAKKIAGKDTVLHQRWFREELDGTPLPEDSAERAGFVKLKDLRGPEDGPIATAEAAQKFEKQYDGPERHPGYKVTVTDIQAVAKAPSKP